MSRKDQLLRVMFALDRHFDDDGISPAHVDRWDELKRQILRMKEGLDLALTVLVSGALANERSCAGRSSMCATASDTMNPPEAQSEHDRTALKNS